MTFRNTIKSVHYLKKKGKKSQNKKTQNNVFKCSTMIENRIQGFK